MPGNKRQTIMLVDDNHANLNIGKNMLKNSYEVYALPSAERLFKFLESVNPDLILLDISMPGMNGLDVIKILKADDRFAHIPVIFVTSKTGEFNELEGLELGAVDYITKPFSSAILFKRIETHLLIEKQKDELKNLNENLIRMVREKSSQISKLQSSIINIIAELIEFRAVYTGGHISRTQKYVELLINYLIEHNIYTKEILSWENMDFVVPSTQLHDLGTIFISEFILNKPSKLTAVEYEIVKSHVPKGVEALRTLEKKGGHQVFLEYAEIVISSHHERWDGGGYPARLKKMEIPLLGRLMAVADVYDSLTSTRPYRSPLTVMEAEKIIINSSGTHFDPTLIGVFKKLTGEFAQIAQNDVDNEEVPRRRC